MKLNDTVYVRWTDAGLRAVEENHKKCLGNLADLYPIFEADCDIDGWSKLKVWELMHILGPHLTMSLDPPLIEGNTFYVAPPESETERVREVVAGIQTSR